MERLKPILSFAGGLAGLLALMCGCTLIFARLGATGIVAVYAGLFLIFFVAFLLFLPPAPRLRISEQLRVRLVPGNDGTERFVLEGPHVSGIMEITVKPR
jgi:uncharacterized protein (DUF58 family)